MTEQQFLQQLEQALDRLPAEERNDILQDIREYFANGRADGKSDSDIAAELGAPDAIAKELIDSFDFTQTTAPAEKSIFRKTNSMELIFRPTIRWCGFRLPMTAKCM
ncbi:DUF1700 domain-containing protein [Planococcus salinarum]|uniref:DUF1700 domain-containing protein n=1 Tax=Planococcus salinarum TaxID=622695 RepID=UPI000E3DBF5E|nr:DUF1700 domain-containing protein [Planococcus salinarum]TAA73108.1 DUF1700 domain-containing protein [Planococcus salinarum]